MVSILLTRNRSEAIPSNHEEEEEYIYFMGFFMFFLFFVFIFNFF